MRDDLTERYVAELRASLREPVAAGRAADLTERADQQAAISTFSTARAAPRAHQRPATRAELGLAACQAVGVYLLTVCAVSFAVYAVGWQAVSSSPPGRYPFAMTRVYPGPPALWLGCGVAGLALLGGCHLARRARQRRRLGRGDVPGAFYSLVTAVFCVALTVALAWDADRPPGHIAALLAAAQVLSG